MISSLYFVLAESVNDFTDFKSVCELPEDKTINVEIEKYGLLSSIEFSGEVIFYVTKFAERREDFSGLMCVFLKNIGKRCEKITVIFEQEEDRK